MNANDIVLALLTSARGTPTTADSIAKQAVALEPDGPLEEALESLRSKGLITQREGSWVLTEGASGIARAAQKRVMSAAFGAALIDLAESPTYEKHCAHVFEADHFQFDMVDSAHRQALVGASALGTGRHFIDLGCATGSLTHWLTRRTGSTALGIDIAPEAIAWATDRFPELDFEVGDLDDLDLPVADTVIAIDTLHFADSLDATLAAVRDALWMGGRLVATFTAKRGKCEGLGLEDMRLGAALVRGGWDVRGQDLTTEAHALWKRSEASLEALRWDFKHEGLEKRWEAMVRETELNLEQYDRGDARRWLVWAT